VADNNADYVRRVLCGGLPDASSRMIAADSPNFSKVRDEQGEKVWSL
jgi:hypothetical protein